MRIPTQGLVSVDTTADLVRLGLVLAVLVALAAAVSRLAGLGYSRAQVTAALRATLQLALVGSVIAAVLDSWWLTAGFAALMLAVASVTAGRRVAPPGSRGWVWGFVPICTGALPTATILLATGVVPLVPIAVVPVVGILVGGAMTATTLSGRRVADALRSRHGEVEAALSLGLLDRDARLLVSRSDAGLANSSSSWPCCSSPSSPRRSPWSCPPAGPSPGRLSSDLRRPTDRAAPPTPRRSHARPDSAPNALRDPR